MFLNNRARKWLPWSLLAVGVAITAGMYWPGVTGGWVFDDYPNIVDNTAIHITPGHSTLAAWVSSAISSPSSFLHRPLASLTFSLNWMAGGGDPWPFKVTNIVIHLINGVLVFCMLRALLRLLALRRVGGPGMTSAEGMAPNPQNPDGHSGAPQGGEPGVGLDDPETDSGFRPAAGPGMTSKGKTAGVAGPGMTSRGIDDSAATRLALIVSAAWLLLPINLMAVLYVVQRMESLCQVFVLVGLWAYLHGRWMMLTADNARRERCGFALAIAGIVLGTMLGLTSKETAVLLPVFAFLAEWIVIGFGRAPQPRGDQPLVIPGLPEGQNPGSVASDTRDFEKTDSGSPLRGVRNDEESERSDWNGDSGEPCVRNDNKDRASAPIGQDKRIWTLFAVTLFIPAILGFLWLLRGALHAASWSGRDFTLVQRLLTESRVLVDYLHWTLLPNPMVLSLYHDEVVKSTGLLTPWTTLGAIVLLVALIVAAVWLRHRRPLVSLGIGWFFAAQLLTATIVPLELVYEQRMYFASIGVLLAAGALLLGLQWKIALPILRGFIVAVALLWFATATNLRAREWSNPLRLAIAEANRHPESPRAVYEAGRLLLIASNYEPGNARDNAWKYLREAAAIPGASALPEQAMIMLADHHQQGDDSAYWNSMTRKLRDQPTRQEDISALISLTNCYEANICKFDVSKLQLAYEATLSRPHPIARLDGAYADFQRDILHDDAKAAQYLARAVKNDPGESAYRVDLAVLYVRGGQTELALEQIDALRRMNLAGRLDSQIAVLETLVKQGKASAPR
jgi:hypothetical protein